jgi:phage terminase small subunit
VSVNLTVITSAQLTEMQERFAYGLSCGLGPTQAAAVVGYANPSVAGARMVGDPRIRAVVKALRNRRIDKLASLSLRELELLIRDRKVSAAVRFNAIKLALGLAGHVEPKGPEMDEGDGKRVAEMTIDELDTFIAEERAKRANAAKPVMEALAIDDGEVQLEGAPTPGVEN